MTTLKNILDDLSGRFERAGIETARLDARVLICELTHTTQADFIAAPEKILPPEEINAIHSAAEKRLAGMPVCKILGKKEFYGRHFKVTAETLSPRPETEILIDTVLKELSDAAPARLLDLGTGTGCIPITLLAERPNMTALALDICPHALSIAQENARAHHVQDRIDYRESDWDGALSPDERFDIITSNPPYIPNREIESLAKEVKNHDPILALCGGDDGLSPYKKIIPAIKMHLNTGGFAVIEIGFGQENEIMRLVENYGLFVAEVIPDLAQIPRIITITKMSQLGKT